MFLNIQALRALAALLVVTAHTATLLPNTWWADWGGSGVDLFFVISGYLMVHTTRRGRTPGEFAIGRITRIVPLYWSVTLFTFVASLVAPHLFASTRPDPIELFKSLLFIPFVKGSGDVRPLVFVGWTLNYEMFFYALFALGLFMGRVGGIVVLAVLAALVAAGSAGHGPIWSFYTDPILLEFGAGMIVALAPPLKSRWLSWLFIVGGLLSIPVLDAVLHDAPRGYRLLLPCAAALTGVIGLELQGAVLRWRPVQVLGDASYAIYLTHPYVSLGLSKLLARTAPWLDPAGVLVALGVSALVGVVVFRWVEHPLGGLVKQAFAASGIRSRSERLPSAPRQDQVCPAPVPPGLG
jgi:exopolysaccharide production protein ExoZ